MPRIISTVLVAALFAGCSTDGKFRTQAIAAGPCGAVTGYTVTGIVYGDSKLVVIPVSRIRAGTEWRFYLRPINRPPGPVDYNTVDVTIDGKFPADPPPPPTRNDWIDVSATSYNNASMPGNYLVECVPAGLLPGQSYQFKVIVDRVGELDPRADVF